ncbi:MAG: hypothetical protein Ctma_0098 [Catillopecten margaritatus gill symbiont]|uniref:Uncharacterized protein n=1 Tax=Catillopecten margaritatus gill symbiont TaxID=3083288 RepID=A0AAU6PEH6_9GAMM
MTPNKENLKSLILNDKSLLVKCCKHSGDIDDNSIDIVILSSIETEQITQLKIGVFFREVLAGCACSDDPSQAIIYENGYCELDAEFNKMTTLISFS